MLQNSSDEDPSEFSDAYRHDHDHVDHKEKAHFVKNRIGGQSLLLDGQRYWKEKTLKDGIIRWCCNKGGSGCRATAHTKGEFIERSTGSHNHSIEIFNSIIESGDAGDVLGVSMPKETFEILINKFGGQTLLFRGQRFFKESTRKDGIVRWRCAKRASVCRATVLTKGEFIERWIDSHNHFIGVCDSSVVGSDPGEIPRASMPKETFELVLNNFGGHTLLFKGHRFFKEGAVRGGLMRWHCTKAVAGCRAAIYTNGECIERLSDSHDHSIGIFDSSI